MLHGCTWLSKLIPASSALHIRKHIGLSAFGTFGGDISVKASLCAREISALSRTSQVSEFPRSSEFQSADSKIGAEIFPSSEKALSEVYHR